MRRFRPIVGFFCILSLAWPTFGLIQQETGTVTGEIKDANGAVVSKASIIVTNVATNISVRTESNDSGLYTATSLRPGLYSISVERDGFRRATISRVTLQVNQVARIDVVLEVGDLSAVVEISTAAPLIESQTSSRGAVIEQRKILELPLNGRDYNQLALLSPGVLPGTPRLAAVNFKGVLNVNGNRTFNNVFLLDGVDNISYSNSFRGENVQLIQPSIEALQEFKIQTNAYSAEFGRSSGAVVNATIRSGTNALRGTAYEFLRNDVLDANNFFSNALRAPKPVRKRNQFGVALGGPIVENRTFWFADYEGLREREGVPRVRQVPTPAQKAGLFSAAVFDPSVEKNNRFANFDPVTGAMRFATDGDLFDRSLIHPDYNNFAPRFGFAYSPTDRWVIRGGYGVFYSHTVRQGREGLLGFNPPFLVDNLIQTGVTGANAIASAAPFRLQNGYPGGLLDPNTLAPTVLRRSQDAFQRTSYVQQYNFGIQREVFTDLLLDVAYVGNKGTKLPGFRNLNQRAVITNPNGSQSAGDRPFPTFGDIQWMENRVLSGYNSLQTRVEKRFSEGLTATVSYTWGKALTEAPDHISTSGGGPGLDTGTFREPQNSNNLKENRGPAEFDIEHRFVASYIYELPFGRGRRWGRDWNGVTELILGGWQLSGIHTLQSGLALTATLGGSTVLSLGGERRARPNLVGNPILPESLRTVDRWFNTEAFEAFSPAPKAFGNAGVGIIRGPGFASFDFTLGKTFRLTETSRIEFRTEVFNAFNRANFNPPDIRAESSSFGQILSSGNARIMQFGLKVHY